MDLTKLVTARQNTGLLLVGDAGLSMKEDAMSLAKYLLSTDRVEEHTDFLLIKPSGEKKTIGVDEVMPLIKKGTMPPIHGKFSVVVIDGMEKLTVSAQNKLLVLLESNSYVFVIGIAYKDTLLDTVKSRMRIVPYRRYEKDEFLSLCSLPAEEATLFYYATAGCPGLVEELESEREMFLSLRQACNTDAERTQLLRVLHLLKEKDKLSVTNDTRLMLCVIRILQFIFQEHAVHSYCAMDMGRACRYQEIVERLIYDEQQCGKSSYTKNDFFNTIVYCVEH